MSVRIAKHTVQDVGRTVDFEKFDKNTLYYLKVGDEVTQLRLRKKWLSELLEVEGFDSFLKKEGINLAEEGDLVKAIAYFDANR